MLWFQVMPIIFYQTRKRCDLLLGEMARLKLRYGYLGTGRCPNPGLQESCRKLWQSQSSDVQWARWCRKKKEREKEETRRWQCGLATATEHAPALPCFWCKTLFSYIVLILLLCHQKFLNTDFVSPEYECIMKQNSKDAFSLVHLDGSIYRLVHLIYRYRFTWLSICWIGQIENWFDRLTR